MRKRRFVADDNRSGHDDLVLRQSEGAVHLPRPHLVPRGEGDDLVDARRPRPPGIRDVQPCYSRFTSPTIFLAGDSFDSDEGMMMTNSTKKAALIVLAVTLVAALSACTTTSGSGGATGGGGTPTSNPRWITGDSLIAYALPWMAVPTYYAGQGGNGFVYNFVGTIESFAVESLGANRPATMLVTGGINDALPSRGITAAATVAAMDHLEATMTSLGIRTVWITEPAFPGIPVEMVAAMAVTNGWMLSRPFHADCATAAVSVLGAGSIDGIHPNGPSAQAFGSCIDAAG